MSCNFLTPRVTDVKAAASDTLSEVSETGTVNSGWTSGWDSREDLRDLVAKIGLQDVSDLHQDRFRVDRKKLEHMLIGDNEAPEPADTFFHKIMEDTNTYITWPSRLKIGAKSKKDPHVRIAGRPEDVQTARERIMSILNTRCNRVTMKIDVSYTDHSHIIGKGGLSIKRVMEETQCHVHFPDSNRSNPTEKSNQVSIAGDIDGVEKARSRVRNLTPLIFCFELPILSSAHTIPDANTPYVAKVQEQYNVQVMFRTRPKLHATLVMVKGVEWEVQQVKQATLMLIEYMCDNLANQITIQMSMEISPHHHQTVIGKNHSNLKSIIQNTNTQVMFPDAQDPNIPSLKKSNVTICGNIHNVYQSRQQLIGSLPLVLMFDLPEDTSDLPISAEQIANIQSSLEVVINIRNKAKQNIMACIIKGIERCAINIYEARNRILGIKEQCIVPDIPSAYFPPQPTVNAVNTEAPPPTINIQPMSPLLSPMISPTWPYPPPPPPTYNQPPFVGIVQHPQFLYNVMPPANIPNNRYQHQPSGQYPGSSLEHSREGSSYSSISSASPAVSPMSSPRNNSPGYHKSANDSPNQGFSSVLAEMNNSGSYHGPTVSRRSSGSDSKQALMPSDYEQKRIAGIRAMQNRLSGGYRTSTSTWSGYGISHTSPGPIQIDNLINNKEDEDIWKTPTTKQDFNFPSTSTCNLNSSNYMEHTPAKIISQITNAKWPDLTTMLASIGLEKYIGLFVSHEIDLSTFPSLTDQDLIELGVTAFGARRKMLLTISELNKRSSPFSAAPGAERKSSSSTISSHGSPRDTNW